MFSTTTIASSTRMPIEKIKANKETRLSVNPRPRTRTAWRSASGSRQPHDHRFAPPNARPTSRITEAGGKSEFLDQLIGLLRRGFAVVTRNGGLNLLRDDGVAQALQARKNRAETSTAFSPGFFVTLMVRAGSAYRCNGRSVCRSGTPKPSSRHGVGPVGALHHLATSRRNTGLPWCEPTTRIAHFVGALCRKVFAGLHGQHLRCSGRTIVDHAYRQAVPLATSTFSAP